MVAGWMWGRIVSGGGFATRLDGPIANRPQAASLPHMLELCLSAKTEWRDSFRKKAMVKTCSNAAIDAP